VSRAINCPRLLKALLRSKSNRSLRPNLYNNPLYTIESTFPKKSEKNKKNIKKVLFSHKWHLPKDDIKNVLIKVLIKAPTQNKGVAKDHIGRKSPSPYCFCYAKEPFATGAINEEFL